jgi:hypothetical protein
VAEDLGQTATSHLHGRAARQSDGSSRLKTLQGTTVPTYSTALHARAAREPLQGDGAQI